MLDIFNELLQCFQLIVHTLFNDLEVVSGLSYGWILLVLEVVDIVIMYLIGRTKE